MRELNLEELRQISTGCYNIQLIDGSYQFQRFPAEVLEFFSPMPSRVVRAEATSGVRIRFRSNTTKLILAGNVKENSPQTEPFVILLNEDKIAELPESGKSGDFENTFRFGNTEEKTIEICFPSYSIGSIKRLMIDENASLQELKRKGIYYAMGNSITQQGGRYMAYADIVARGLELDLHEAGVGGHIFEAESLPFVYVEKPALITIAYGTNDWNGSRPIENARIFLQRLTSLYPDTPVFLLEPLRRYSPLAPDGKKLADNKAGYSLEHYRRQYRKIATEFPTVKVIHYKKLIPDNPELFTDGVHPSAEGHKVFGENLLKELRKSYKPKP